MDQLAFGTKTTSAENPDPACFHGVFLVLDRFSRLNGWQKSDSALNEGFIT